MQHTAMIILTQSTIINTLFYTFSQTLSTKRSLVRLHRIQQDKTNYGTLWSKICDHKLQ